MDRRPNAPDLDEEDDSEEVTTLPHGDVYLPYRLDNSEGFVENLERKIDQRIKELDEAELGDLESLSWDDEDLFATPEDWEDYE